MIELLDNVHGRSRNFTSQEPVNPPAPSLVPFTKCSGSANSRRPSKYENIRAFLFASCSFWNPPSPLEGINHFPRSPGTSSFEFDVHDVHAAFDPALSECRLP
jgi:hypothetical protein